MAQDRISPEVFDDLAELKKAPPNLAPKRARNGGSSYAPDGLGVPQGPPNTIAFSIGIDVINVPEMTWDILETVMPMLEKTSEPDEKWYRTKVRDFEIFLIVSKFVAPDLTLEKLKKMLTLRQANELSAKLLELLKLSGFTIPGESTAANGSTETLTVSSQELSDDVGQELLSGTKSNGQ